MEPRRERRGKLGYRNVYFRVSEQLQWSHGASAVENVHGRLGRMGPIPASMEPRRERRGKTEALLVQNARAGSASMEPRRERRGKLAHPKGDASCGWLASMEPRRERRGKRSRTQITSSKGSN